MLENRSFDSLLGWLYDADNPPEHVIAGPKQRDTPFYGLAENRYHNSFSGENEKQYVKRGTRQLNTPSPDPNEPYLNVNMQLFGSSENPPENQPPSMDGFLKDYASIKYSLFGGLYEQDPEALEHIGEPLSRETALEILETFTPDQLPIINTLAKHYAVSDYYFSSVPTQTNANRAFALCGTSMGYVDNQGFLDGFVPAKFKTKSIWNVLYENGFTSPDDWIVYHQDRLFRLFCFTQTAFDIPDPQNHVRPIEDFFERIKTDTLPSFSYLEPAWFHAHLFGKLDTLPINGNSFHPPADLAPGELFLSTLYESLSQNREVWEKTLLVINFDEHGGTYDHVPPPWGALPPWGNALSPDGIKLEHGFRFNRFGVRVPALLISPWIEPKTVFRSTGEIPYDHTSVLATILKWKGISKEKWGLGERVFHAPTFESVLTRTTPRTDTVKLALSDEEEAYLKRFSTSDTSVITPMQAKMLPVYLHQLSGGKFDAQSLGQLAEEILKRSKSPGDLERSIAEFAKKHAVDPED